MSQLNVDLLDQHCAKAKSPIRIDCPSPFNPRCQPLEPVRAQFISDRFPIDKAHSEIKALSEGLIRFGGSATLIPSIEEDLQHLVHRGQLWGSTSKMMKGRNSKCHENSCLLWESNQDKLFLATGYALSADGLWRQHSWCVLPKPRSIQIVETTERRELYFGYIMTLEETLSFGSNNTDMGVEADEFTRERYAAICEQTSPENQPERMRS